MKTTKDNVIRMINQTIIDNKSSVIRALRDSKVEVSSSISDRDLAKLVMTELNKGNGYLMYNLGQVLDSKFDIAQEMSNAEGEKKGFFGSIGDFFSKNKDAIGAGASLLGGLFGGGKGEPASTGTTPPSSDQNAIMMQMQLAQQQQQQQFAAAERARREDEAARRRNALLIGGIVGGVLIIGTVITINP